MKKDIWAGAVVLVIAIILSEIAAAEPYGATITEGTSSRRERPGATNVTAGGGNVSYIVADLSQITETWQGFYGKVTGGISLGDAGGNTFYDWDVVEAVGEIIATRSFVTDWSGINCSNQTEIYLEEERLNIPNSTSDGINDTFTDINHPDFMIAGKTISGCRATRTHNSTNPQAIFWNVLMNTNASNTVYTVIMDSNKEGYNGTIVDFQMLVPVDKTTGVAEYYIYVELD